MACPRPCSQELQSWDSNSNSNYELSWTQSARGLVSATLMKALIFPHL